MSVVSTEELLQDVPLHSEHTLEHSIPFFLQLQRRLSQSPLHLHRMILSKKSGAGIESILFGSK
ncbi:hypothetical protein BOV92_13135 [Solemya velum gill symbiont]|nr:hypothetical protein BOV92_13135 [Solemya velum gill symbiont]